MPDVSRKLRFLPQLEGPRRIIGITFGMQKLEWCGYPTVKFFTIGYPYHWKIFEDMHVYSFWQNTWTWRTDGRQTDAARRHKLRLCIASRGKNGVETSDSGCCKHSVIPTLNRLMLLSVYMQRNYYMQPTDYSCPVDNIHHYSRWGYGRASEIGSFTRQKRRHQQQLQQYQRYFRIP